MEIVLGVRQILLNGTTAPPAPTKKFGHVCCDQTAGWIKMPLRREVGLSPGHIILDENPPPPPQRGTASNFRSMSIVAKWSPISATAEHLLRFITEKVTCLQV